MANVLFFLMFFSVVLVASDQKHGVSGLIREGMDLVAKEKYPESRNCFEQAEQLDTNNVEVHLGFWGSYFYEDNENKALEVLQLVQAGVERGDSSREVGMEYWWAFGYTLQCLGGLEEAKQHFHKVIDEEPINESRKYWHNRGRVLLCLKNFEGAADCFQKALDLFQEDWPTEQAKILGGLGHAHIGAKQYEQAEQCLRRAIEQNPNRSQYYDSLATALRKLDKIEEAVWYYGKALKKNPRLMHTKSNLALCHYKRGSWYKALRLLKKVLKHDPNHYETHYRLAKLYKDGAEVGKAYPFLVKEGKIDSKCALYAKEHAQKALQASDVGSIVPKEKVQKILEQLAHV